MGTTAAPPGSGADGNGDGSINGGDLAVWRDNYKTAYTAVAAQAEAVVASVILGEDDDAQAPTAASRDAIFAGGDFAQLFAEARAFRPQRRRRGAR